MKPEIDKRGLALAWMRTLGLHGPAWSEDDVKYFMRDEPAVDQIAAETNQVAAEKDFTFAEYGAQALMAAAYPGGTTIDALSYLALKLAGEAGEVAQKIAKAVRDNASVIDETRRLALLDECGDVLWYLNALASELNSGLTEVAQRNLAKVKDRQARGAIGGDGDNR